MLDHSLKIAAAIYLNSTPEKVWEVLTSPLEISKYLHGTETITDWKVGSPIVFQGEYNRRRYKDYGKIIAFEPGVKLAYSYYTAYSGLEDAPENYAIITVSIQKIAKNEVELTWTQTGFQAEVERKNAESGLPPMLEIIKGIVE